MLSISRYPADSANIKNEKHDPIKIGDSKFLVFRKIDGLRYSLTEAVSNSKMLQAPSAIESTLPVNHFSAITA